MRMVIQTRGYVFDSEVVFHKVYDLTKRFKNENRLNDDTIKLFQVGDNGLEVTYRGEVTQEMTLDYEEKLHLLDINSKPLVLEDLMESG
ncbi:hypothetical protein Elgi_69160 [Paenibacillus elgii]|uniref:hypothetical protein n=1 Tax=Paenibacillus elgii TaxID=189691 RepID=UPI002D7B785B|nr:hypothetical protein Elgi_69160 [Paenibacillus elgii]